MELAFLHEFAGSAALGQRRLDDAWAHEEAAIRLLQVAGNRERQAALYHQLGIIAYLRRTYLDAETNYRKALDIKLEYGDQHSAALTYHQLGILTQDQHRYDEAETNYRKALDIHRESDRRNASTTAIRLGGLLAVLGRHPEAARIFLYAAVTWHQETGSWAEQVLRALRQERAAIEGDEFTRLLTEDLPEGLAPKFMAAMDEIDEADDSGDTDAPSTGDTTATA